MKKWPLLPSLLTMLAVGSMIGLGIWQLQRKDEKEQLLSQLVANQSKPPIAYPALGPVAPDALFRQSSVMCLRVTGWTEGSGRDAQGQAGLRYIAQCVTGAEGPGAIIVAGVNNSTGAQGEWTGGAVEGIITNEPDQRSMITKLLGDEVVLRPMLVSKTGLGGLRAPQLPSPDTIANNHLLYAIQWFVFAGAAAIIFILAVLKRQREQSTDGIAPPM